MTGGFDLLIKNGRVLDGTGSPFIKQDVGGISNGKIEAMGKTDGLARKVIDAQGQKMFVPAFHRLPQPHRPV